MPILTPANIRPVLTDAQKDAVLAAGAELVIAAAADRSPVLEDPTFAGAADISVGGVFVSLKRRKSLRGCTGGLRPQSIRLGTALADAAEGTVLRDQRFPPISPGEVAFLTLEIWLLYNPQPVAAQGEDRVGAVVVGKHGLVISNGAQHGLLLPGVPVDMGWDSRQFLEHVCHKAGMHPTLWKDPATTLLSFEGDAIHADLRKFTAPLSAPPIVDSDELTGYFNFCWDNIVAMFEGKTLRYFDIGLRDVAVPGVTVRLKPPAGDPILLTSLMMPRGSSPVQNTLVQFAQTGAQQLARRGIRLETLSTVGMGLTIYADLNMHGPANNADLRGIDPKTRSVMIVERAKQGIVFDPSLTPNELLYAAAREASVNSPAQSAVYSLQTLSTDKAVSVSTAPKPRRGPAERPPAVAGTFYPANPDELAHTVSDLIEKARPMALPKRKVPAAMVPHAGLRFSGAIAAQVLLSVELPKTILILGPKHTALGMEWAVAPQGAWQIPGGEVASDFMVARKLSQAIPGLALDAAAHEREHSIEVELPLLAQLAPGSRVVGIAVAGGNWPAACRFAEGLAAFLKSQPEPPLLLISSDMNHFATDDETRRLDEIALTAIETLDPLNALKTIHGQSISMCGVFPAVIVMETLRRLGQLTKTTRCGYATSADATGDKSRVVGYAGMLFE